MPRAIELQTIDRALLSAYLQVCGEEYVAVSYMPYMNRLRASGQYSARQLAYLGILHGLTVGTLSRSAGSARPDCSEPVLAELRRRAAAPEPEAP